LLLQLKSAIGVLLPAHAVKGHIGKKAGKLSECDPPQSARFTADTACGRQAQLRKRLSLSASMAQNS
jgi:hypothetical protein